MVLFDPPKCASGDAVEIAAGGLGCGQFVYTAQGEFRRWRMQHGQPAADEPAPANRFHLWLREGGRSRAVTLGAASGDSPWSEQTLHHAERVRAFPIVLDDHSALDLTVRLDSYAFSPMLPDGLREASLPLYVIAWRARNEAARPVELAMMLSWQFATPEPALDAAFDMQHDNLCVAGALGGPARPERMVVAIPDLHSEGVFQQGVEPWDVNGGAADLWQDFSEDGELDSSLPPNGPSGAAAWLKLKLEPGRTVELPFVIAWHQPVYPDGSPRYYTQFLEKRRPDNAIIWLAEEPVQNFGQETSNYRYWMLRLRDWHADLAESPLLSQAERRQLLTELTSLHQSPVKWSEDGRVQSSEPPATPLLRTLSSGNPALPAWAQRMLGKR